MADKTVNVNIKYNVDTAQIQRAEAASRAAQGATDRLRKSVDDYGKAAAQANKTAQDTLKKTSVDVNALSKDFNGLYTSIRAVVTAGLAKELVDATLNMARLSGQVDGVNRAFSKIPNATLLLNDLRKATHGTVTDLALMQKALTAQNFRIPLEKLGTLLEFAAVKAQQTGQEVNHLVDYIVSGIGYRSIKRLDDLGFTANRVKEALGGVSLQAASMGEVMDAVTKLMQEDLQKTGGFAETSATQVGNLERKWHELKVSVSEALTLPSWLKFLETTLDNIIAGVDYLRGGSGRIMEKMAKENAIKEVETFKEMTLTKEILKDKEKTLDVVQAEANLRQNHIYRNNEELKQIKEKYNEITNSGRFMTRQEEAQAEELVKQSGFYQRKNMMLRESIRILVEYMDSLKKISKEEGGDSEDGPSDRFLPDKVALFDVKSVKVPLDKKALQQQLVDADAQIKKLVQEMQENGYLTYQILPAQPGTPGYQDSDFEKAFEENRKAIAFSAIDNTQFIINETIARELDGYKQRIENLHSFYNEQELLAGDNERAKKELRIKGEREVADLQRQMAEKEKRARLASIIVNTAAAIAKVFADYGYPAGIIPAAIAAGEGATQYAIASRARYYAKGEINIKGPGSETSDSIPAMLSKGESIMTAKQTREAFGILTDIRAGRLNDKIIKQITTNGGVAVMDDSRIVDELRGIRKNKAPDLVKQGRQIYEVYTSQSGNKRFIRSKSI